MLISGTLYSPTDGTIDPNGICTATTRSAKKAGAKVSIDGEVHNYRNLVYNKKYKSCNPTSLKL